MTGLPYDEIRAQAESALTHALIGDLDGGHEHLTGLWRARGSEAVTAAIVMLCDTLILAQGLTPGQVRQPTWLHPQTGEALGADDADPMFRWAGQLVAARAALDNDGFNALLDAPGDDPQRTGEHVRVLLASVAGTLNLLNARAQDRARKALLS